MDVAYGYIPYVSAYSANDLRSAFKKLTEINPIFKPKTPLLKGIMPNLPIGWAVAFPHRSGSDFYINNSDESKDYEISIYPWNQIHTLLKRNARFKWFDSNTNNIWLHPENIITQPDTTEFIVVKRTGYSELISKFDVSVMAYRSDIVQNLNKAVLTSINSSVPLFLFTLPDIIPLNIEIDNNIQISYSNMGTNIKCLQNLCESAFVGLSQSSISRFKADYELAYTENTVFYYTKSDQSVFLGHVVSIYEYLKLYISFPTKFSAILNYDYDAVLHVDEHNTSNFLYNVPKVNNRFEFVHYKMPLVKNDIKPPFFLQLKNSYNEPNIEINGKVLSCLAILNEKHTNSLEFSETFQTNFLAFPNQYLQFVVTDINNNVIHLHKDSMIIISIFSNNDQ